MVISLGFSVVVLPPLNKNLFKGKFKTQPPASNQFPAVVIVKDNRMQLRGKKGPVSSLRWGPFSGANSHFGRTKINFSGFKKWNRKKRFSSLARCLLYAVTGGLQPTCAHFLWGPDLFYGGPANNILREPCQQLLTHKSPTNAARTSLNLWPIGSWILKSSPICMV